MAALRAAGASLLHVIMTECSLCKHNELASFLCPYAYVVSSLVRPRTHLGPTV